MKDDFFCRKKANHKKMPLAGLSQRGPHIYIYIYIYTVQVHLKKKIEYHEKVNIFYHSFQKGKPINYIDSLHIK